MPGKVGTSRRAAIAAAAVVLCVVLAVVGGCSNGGKDLGERSGDRVPSTLQEIYDAVAEGMTGDEVKAMAEDSGFFVKAMNSGTGHVTLYITEDEDALKDAPRIQCDHLQVKYAAGYQGKVEEATYHKAEGSGGAHKSFG